MQACTRDRISTKTHHQDYSKSNFSILNTSSKFPIKFFVYDSHFMLKGNLFRSTCKHRVNMSIIVDKTLTICVCVLLEGCFSIDFMSMLHFVSMLIHGLSLFLNTDKDRFVDTDYINFYHDMQYTA